MLLREEIWGQNKWCAGQRIWQPNDTPDRKAPQSTWPKNRITPNYQLRRIWPSRTIEWVGNILKLGHCQFSGSKDAPRCPAMPREIFEYDSNISWHTKQQSADTLRGALAVAKSAVTKFKKAIYSIQLLAVAKFLYCGFPQIFLYRSVLIKADW